MSSSSASWPRRDTLIMRCAAGDADAFEQLYKEHRGLVARLARNVAGPRSDLDDIVQEVFIQVLRSIGSFQGESKFTTWLYRLTVNVTLQFVKARRNRTMPYLEVEERRDLRSDSPSPELEAWDRERWSILSGILDTLPEKKRVVFVLHEIEGLGAGEIAGILGIPTLTVRTRLFYARREVYDRLARNPDLLAGMRGGGMA